MIMICMEEIMPILSFWWNFKFKLGILVLINKLRDYFDMVNITLVIKDIGDIIKLIILINYIKFK